LYYNFVMRARPKQDTTVSVRITRDEERVVRQLAKRQKSTVSHVIRSAVSDLVRREEQKPLRPYDQIEDVIGSVADLPPGLAATTGGQLAEMMREKAGKRK
jgi:hypothetical protein